MDLFVDKPELLGETQTLIGVLLTFIVLCLFSNESNFLLMLICNMVADFTANLKDKIDEIKKEIEQEKKKSDAAMGPIANNRSYWVNQAKTQHPELHQELMDNNKKELEIRNQILNDIGPEIESYNQSGDLLKMKEENKFVSLYFLILMLVVMTMDACCVSSAAGGIFLVLENIITFYFTGCLWYHYIVEKKKNVKYDEHSHIFTKVLLGVFLMVIIWMGGLSFSILSLSVFWLFTIGSISLAVFFMSYWLMCNFRYTVRYNNQFIIKHALYIVFICILLTCLLFFLCTIDVKGGDTYFHMALYNLQENIKYIMKNIFWVRFVFVLLCSANSFFIPLLIGYFYNHIKAKHVQKIMNSSKQDIVEKIKKNNNEYQQIVKKIQDVCTKP